MGRQDAGDLVQEVRASSPAVGSLEIPSRSPDEPIPSAPTQYSTCEPLKGVELNLVRKRFYQPGVERLDCTSPALLVLLRAPDTKAEIRLHPGRPSSATTVAYLPAGSSAWIHTSDSSSCRWLRLNIASDAFDDGGLPAELLTGSSARLYPKDHDLVICADLMSRECECNGGRSSRYLESLVAAILLLLAESPNAESDRPQTGGLAPWQFKRATDAMRDGIGGRIDIADIASEVRTSPSHFRRAFKRTTGLTPQAWISKLRIDRAQELMLGSDLSLAEVTTQVGFSDQSHLTRRFRQVTGMSPSEWRRRQPRP
ncbi:hypothetical protein CLBKND_04776 [Methylorubrum aminovorans]